MARSVDENTFCIGLGLNIMTAITTATTNNNDNNKTLFFIFSYEEGNTRVADHETSLNLITDRFAEIYDYLQNFTL
jgi:hypothetical protein